MLYLREGGMTQLPDNINKALQFLAYVMYAKGAGDVEAGRRLSEKELEDFIKDKIKHIESLL